MKLLKTIAFTTLTTSLSLPFLMQTPAQASNPSPSILLKNPHVVLPESSQQLKINQAIAWKLSKKYKSEFVNRSSDNKKILTSLRIPLNVKDINGTVKVHIPRDIMQALKASHQLMLNGTGLRSVKAKWESNKNHLKGDVEENTWFIDTKKPFVMRSINVKNNNYDDYNLIITGKAHVNSVDLEFSPGIPEKFDDSPWSIIGLHKPIYKANVSVDLTTKRSIAGESRFQKEKFNRTYASAYLDSNTVSVGYEANRRAYKFGFVPGRQMTKFKEHLQGLNEDPKHKGYADPAYFKNKYKQDNALINDYKKLYGNNHFSYATCLDDYPDWMKLKAPSNNRGTPDQAYFEQAGDLASQYVSGVIRQTNGHGPHWVEVKNEPTIASEWSYFTIKKPQEAWNILADLHNKVAKHIKKKHPEVQVGGPTSAFMVLDKDNFTTAKYQLKFMDDTKGHLDFYSHHFYETQHLVTKDAKDSGGYLNGRLIADLDLLENHMSKTNNVKPILVSETGTYIHATSSDLDQWIKLKTFNAYMLQYYNNQNNFAMTQPFLLPITWWNKPAQGNIYKYNKDLTALAKEPTLQERYLRFWKDYKGTLLPVTASNSDLHVHSVTVGNKVYVAVNNLSNQRAYVNLNINKGNNKVTNITRHRLYMNMGKFFDTNETVKNLSKIPFAVDETAIIEIDLKNKPNLIGSINELKFYGDKELQPTGSTNLFHVLTPTTRLKSSILRVGFGKKNGFTSSLTVNVNGHKFKKSIADTKCNSDFFGHVEFKIPASILQANNKITTYIPQKGGKVASVVLLNKYN